jgi:hypothetical protein
VPLDGILEAIDLADSETAWTILMLHSVELDDYYARISLADFEAMVDHAIDAGLWVDTFGRVASYLRGQQAIEAASPVTSAGHYEWSWTVPPATPAGTIVRAVIDGGELRQGGAPLEWNSIDGYYPVDVSRGELVWDR